MSILNVEHLTHGFGDRAIFNDVSFRLLKGEHIGLVGANGEGKSTFFNIVTGKLMPDEGKIEWAKNVRVGYLDQHSVLSQGMSIRDVLKSAFSYLFEMEERMNEICDSLGTASPEEMDTLMEELGTIQDTLTMHDFYVIDAKVEEVARALGLLDIGLERDVTDLSGGQRTKVLLGKLLLEKPDILLLDEPTNYLDEEHIEWLKRYLQDYENAFILISHDIPFLNSVINLVYHMENQELNRYVGDYDHFQEVYEVKKAQLEAAYRRQQQEISELKDFVARNKARVSTRNMAMSRQKKLDKMDVIELAAEKPKPEFHFKYGRTPGKYIFETKDLVIGYNEPLSRPVTLSMERGNKKWEWLGWWPSITAFFILGYYSMILSWAMKYFTLSFSKGWGSDPNSFFYNDFLKLTDSPFQFGTVIWPVLIGIILVWGISWFICYKGVKGGIEKLNKVLLPTLVGIMIVIVVRGITLEGATLGLNKLFTPDWNKVMEPKVWIAAYGQVFYSLSLAMGIMMTYSSYLPKKTDINNSAFMTGFANCGFEFLCAIKFSPF